MFRTVSLAACLLLTACADVTWSDRPAATGTISAPAPKLTLVALPSSVDVQSLQELFAPADGKAVPNTPSVWRRLADFQARAGQELEQALAGRGFTVSRAEAAQLPAGTSASTPESDYLLQWRITDFGRSPRKWIGWYVGWEIVSTLAVATLAYVKPRTRPLAGAYLLEETVEEAVEGYTGFWAIDRLWSPIRIEASLTDLRTGAVVSTDSSTGMADGHLSRLLSRARDADLDRQLQDALRRSAAGLAEEVADAVRRVPRQP